MNQVSPFEYVSILVSIILGLGITQILSSFSNLLYTFHKVKFYGPHTIWIVFILYLHIQDWFITYQLKDKVSWNLPEVLFVLIYPVILYIIAKIMLPDKDNEENESMEKYYYSQSSNLFLLMSMAILSSILFNVFLLGNTLAGQSLLIVFLAATSILGLSKNKSVIIHKAFSIIVLVSTLLSTIYENKNWVIK